MTENQATSTETVSLADFEEAGQAATGRKSTNSAVVAAENLTPGNALKISHVCGFARYRTKKSDELGLGVGTCPTMAALRSAQRTEALPKELVFKHGRDGDIWIAYPAPVAVARKRGASS